MNGAYLYRVPAGAPGAVTRMQVSTIKQEILDVENVPDAYGVPVKIGANGKIQKATSADGSVYGFLVRPYPHQASATVNAAAPQGGTVCDVLLSGYISVAVLDTENTAAKNASAHVSDGGSVSIQGGKAISGAFFEGAADARGNVEIRFNI